MQHTMVAYSVNPGREEENAALVRDVFAELAETRPAGLRYCGVLFPDQRQFVHLYTDEGGTTGVQALDSFESLPRRSGGPPRAAGHLHTARTDRRYRTFDDPDDPDDPALRRLTSAPAGSTQLAP